MHARHVVYYLLPCRGPNGDINTRLVQGIISGIPLWLGLTTRLKKNSVSLVCWAPTCPKVARLRASFQTLQSCCSRSCPAPTSRPQGSRRAARNPRRSHVVLYVFMYVCMHACMHVYMCVYIYIYISYRMYSAYKLRCKYRGTALLSPPPTCFLLEDYMHHNTVAAPVLLSTT